jgi:hypothetical protein
MAGHPKERKQVTTDKSMLERAATVALTPPPDRLVLYAEDEGARLAEKFIASNCGFQRLDELLRTTPAGRELFQELTVGGRAWSDLEEVWWELSWRVARAARGVVNVFGPRRLIEDRPLSEFRHKYTTGAYANTVFEKVELPELEQNPYVTAIFYNGQRFS